MVQVTAWEKLGEVCAKHLRKGRLVLIEGKLVSNNDGEPAVYTDNSGTKRASFKIKANTIKFLGPKNQEVQVMEEHSEVLKDDIIF